MYLTSIAVFSQQDNEVINAVATNNSKNLNAFNGFAAFIAEVCNNKKPQLQCTLFCGFLIIIYLFKTYSLFVLYSCLSLKIRDITTIPNTSNAIVTILIISDKI